MARISRWLPPSLVRWLKIVFQPRRVAVLPDSVSYEEDGLATIHSADFQREPRFAAAYRQALQTGSWSGVAWRAHVIAWAAEYALPLPGDFVECGVNRGGFSRLIVEYLNLQGSQKRFYLLDTFAGLVTQYVSEEEKNRGLLDAYRYEDCYEAVKRTFADCPNVVIVKGAVPETLPEVRSERLAFISIDMNCVEPEIAAANAFWDRLSPGGIIVLDDYGHPLHVAQKRAFDAFAAERGVTVLSLPTAQGIIVKPHQHSRA
jgi:O-methyltransferase